MALTRREITARYRAKHPEKVRAQVKAYKDAHKDRARELRKAWTEKNREQLRALDKVRSKAYREAHPDKVRAYQREWDRKNRDKLNAKHRERWAVYKKSRNLERIKEQRRTRYHKNAEKHRQIAREYAASHKQEAKARSLKWYLANKAHARALAKAYVEQDPEKWREYYRQYHQRNRDRREQQARAWRENNPALARACSRRSDINRKARKRKVFVERIDPAEVFKRAKGICGLCMKTVDPNSRWEIDHIMPISRGGLHEYANVQLAHRRCNRSKGAKVA